MPHFYKLQIGKYIHLGVLGLFNMANWHFYLGSRSRRATPTSALHYHGDCLLTSVPLFTTGWGYFENGTAHRRYGWVFFIYCKYLVLLLATFFTWRKPRHGYWILWARVKNLTVPTTSLRCSVGHSPLLTDVRTILDNRTKYT